jgi:hypothetical protein
LSSPKTRASIQLSERRNGRPGASAPAAIMGTSVKRLSFTWRSNAVKYSTSCQGPMPFGPISSKRASAEEISSASRGSQNPAPSETGEKQPSSTGLLRRRLIQPTATLISW